MRILLIEDDRALCQVLQPTLEAAGFASDCCHNGADGLALLRTGYYDACILDRMLPELDGLLLLQSARADGVTIPVLMLTALSQVGDRVEGLDAGADDYLAKPFDLDELLARIEVQLRHRARVPAPQPGGDVLRVGAWTVDRAARTLAVDGADVPLTRTEFNIVELLALHPKKVYTKQELFELAWGEPYAAEDSTVSVHVSNIRAKLKPTGTDGYLCTVWGLGFKLAVDEGA